MQTFEKIFANVAAKCEYNYGAMGRTGYLYESVKDQIRWANLSVKNYVGLISQIGQVMSYSDKDYNKYKVEHSQMSDKAISEVFLRAFGDGK